MAALPSSEDLFEDAACGLVLTDAHGLILRANAAARYWLGYEAAELAGKLRMLDLLPVGARLFHHAHCLPSLQGQGSVADLRITLRTRRGGRRPMLINTVRGKHAGQVLAQWALCKGVGRHAYEHELLGARKAAEAELE